MSERPASLHELLPGILEWPWFSERFGYDFHGFLIRTRSEYGDGNLVVDPVEMTEPVLAGLVAEGAGRIVLTNRNHFRDAQRLHEATHAPVLVHPADADFVRGKGVMVGGELRPGERVGPFHILGCPGKSPGEVVLHWPARRLLILGDAAVGKSPGVLGLLPEAVMDDPPRLRESLASIASGVDVDTVLCADGHHAMTGGSAALAALVASF